ncbi:hypothetical protein Glove_155g4 [Diversispora epigaea]|uniref:Uncharacterized protein n=1 Tax=Diversispora epigaea TaxID=1348612 RepID=A0A397IS69_9GLOM|nr:hypothetical protein Glove_155g4 [Diversispora epigaea]
MSEIFRIMTSWTIFYCRDMGNGGAFIIEYFFIHCQCEHDFSGNEFEPLNRTFSSETKVTTTIRTIKTTATTTTARTITTTTKSISTTTRTTTAKCDELFIINLLAMSRYQQEIETFVGTNHSNSLTMLAAIASKVRSQIRGKRRKTDDLEASITIFTASTIIIPIPITRNSTNSTTKLIISKSLAASSKQIVM